jgi:Ankyrin repeats (3 copies)/Ankyrin repeats (many copies)
MSNVCVAYIYFDYKITDQTDDNIVRSLLKQLLVQSKVIPSDLESHYNDCCSLSKSPDGAIFSQSLFSSIANFSSVYILFDALDECSDKTFNEISALIRRLKDTKELHVFCTSRPHIDFKDALHTHDVHLIQAHDDDVKNYLSIRVKREWRHNPRFQDQIIDKLAQATQGKFGPTKLELLIKLRFLLARFQLDHILDKVRPRDAINALNTLPTDMDSAYTEVLDRIDKTGGKGIAIQILSWLFHAQRPLKMDELQEVLSIELDDTELNRDYFIEPDKIIHHCQGLVESDETNVRFTHYTVQEFLRNKYYDNLLAPKDLAKVCLTYLTFDVFENGPFSDRKSFNECWETHKFAEYAVRYWGIYTRGEGEKDRYVIDSIFKLFQSSHKRRTMHQLFIQQPRGIFRGASKLTIWTPLHIIAQEGLATIYERCISASFDNNNMSPLSRQSLRDLESGPPNSLDEECNTPLHLAASNGHSEVVKLLLEAKAEVDSKSNYGRTPMSWAAWNGHSEVVKLLLEAKAEVDSKDSNGRTPMSLAAWNGHSEVVKLLLEAKAEVDSKDSNGRTPMSWAAWNGHSEVVKLLEKALDDKKGEKQDHQ